jgi:HD-GYP domain-containing protein (c-di-GMP phosphodiesterase class II)
MSKTIVVSDNDILNQLYIINLEVYLATKVTLIHSVEEAQENILLGNDYDLIITMNMINGQDSAIAIHEFLKKNEKSIPMIVIGKPTVEIPNIVIVQSSFHLENLLRSSAGILGVTAQSMAELLVPDYFSIETKFLIRLGVAPCQIFMQTIKKNEEGAYVMVAKQGSNTTDVLTKIFNEGVETLFVNKLDRLLVINQISKNICQYIQNTEKLEVPEKSKALEVGFDFVASNFCRSPEAINEVMNIATACTKVMEEISKDTPGLRALMNTLKSDKNGFVYSHSILASFVAHHIVRKVSWGGEGQLEKINFVLFFHDIMLAPIYLKYPTLKYEEDLLFSNDLSEKEKEIVLNHARLAAELIINFKRTPMGADLLIKQHHGMTNGIGYAIEFKDDISPLTKIVLISEAFIEEYMKGKESDPNYQIDVKKIISVLTDKFKKSTYKKIIDTLETIRL